MDQITLRHGPIPAYLAYGNPDTTGWWIDGLELDEDTSDAVSTTIPRGSWGVAQDWATKAILKLQDLRAMAGSWRGALPVQGGSEDVVFIPTLYRRVHEVVLVTRGGDEHRMTAQNRDMAVTLANIVSATGRVYEVPQALDPRGSSSDIEEVTVYVPASEVVAVRHVVRLGEVAQK